MKIAIVGGGAGGYFSALLFKKRYPEYEITVIDSSKIGILGPGEGTTPAFYETLKSLNIDIDNFIKETNATVKNGLKFVSWGTEKDFYFHSFVNKYIDIDPIDENISTDEIKKQISVLAYSAIKDKNLDMISPEAQASYNDKVFTEKHAWHIDARLLAAFLNKEAVSRGIKIIDGIVDEIIVNEFNEITSLSIDKKIFDFDFFVDSSGFKRLIIGNHYKSEWVDTSKSLPCDNALVFFMYNQEQELHGEAIAMDYGWAWKTPLQHRFGCGYVYDSKYITKEKAIEEVKQKFGNDIEIINNFSFNSGYYKESLVKNCLAIGLSSSFFEPMEATAIYSSIRMCSRFLNFYSDDYFKNKDKNIADKYNADITNFNEDIVAFLYFHFITNKKNTDFWKNFTKNNVYPERTKKYLEKINNIFSNKNSIETQTHPVFAFKSWIVVYFGNELYDKKILESWINDISKKEYEHIREEIKNSKTNMTIDKYLEYIKTKSNK
jgi:tryptophan halogenase